MSGKVGKLNIGRTEFTFVLRHKFEKEQDLYDRMRWREYRLGLWFKRSQIVGRKNFQTPSEWKNNFVYSYMWGIDLIICKVWVTAQSGGMVLNIDDEK